MGTAKVVGIVLIVLGVISLAYQGITFTREEKAIDIGPIEVTTKEKERIPLPPVLGAIALVGGIALVIAGARRE